MKDSEGSVHRLLFHGEGSDLFRIFTLNLFKTVFTFGTYVFWAKTKTRQYLWSQSEFSGDRFTYYGTGKELLVGALKAGILFGGLFALDSVAGLLLQPSIPFTILSQTLFLTAFFILASLARVGATRYRLTRTSWRGIRFSFHGQERSFLRLSARGALLSVLTLGLYQPYYHCAVRRFIVENSRFGSITLSFSGHGKDLWKPYIRTLVFSTLGTVSLLVLTAFFASLMGLVVGIMGVVATAGFAGWLWTSYFALRRRYYWDHTSVAGASFRSTIDAGDLFELYAINVGIILLSLGLAMPWVTVRNRRYDFAHLALHGDVDFPGIIQNAQDASATSDEMAGFLDVDALPG